MRFDLTHLSFCDNLRRLYEFLTVILRFLTSVPRRNISTSSLKITLSLCTHLSIRITTMGCCISSEKLERDRARQLLAEMEKSGSEKNIKELKERRRMKNQNDLNEEGKKSAGADYNQRAKFANA